MSSHHIFYCSNCQHDTLGQFIDIQAKSGIILGIKCTECGTVKTLEELDILNNKKNLKPKIDENTKFKLGSPEYNDYYYYSKKDKPGLHR